MKLLKVMKRVDDKVLWDGNIHIIGINHLMATARVCMYSHSGDSYNLTFDDAEEMRKLAARLVEMADTIEKLGG